ncbi:MAG: OmpA family protein [SAR202 cluster bacterium]|jgi:flagellar motor protein MotB|nr:OmpA family protein [SAR202 cluster bacterium]|tara:strand:+ start:9818 stop:10528 length:711 start_codon:yes stop_codon:yes gene_type:complete
MRKTSKDLESEWLSIGDLMSVLLLLMVLVVLVALFQIGAVEVEYESVIKENTKLGKMVDEYEESKYKILKSISDRLENAGVFHTFNEKIGSISISGDLLFIYGKTEYLSDDGEAALSKLVPIINEVMYMNDTARSEIIGLEITGYASEYRHGKNAYMKNNMDLSLSRAEKVWVFMQNLNGLLEEEDFFQKIKVVGRGSYHANSYDDIPSDRKVDFVFQFKGPIASIRKIINKKTVV